MIWIFCALLAGSAATAVAAWARGVRKAAEAETAARRAKASLDQDEALLLAKLRSKQD